MLFRSVSQSRYVVRLFRRGFRSRNVHRLGFGSRRYFGCCRFDPSRRIFQQRFLLRRQLFQPYSPRFPLRLVLLRDLIIHSFKNSPDFSGLPPFLQFVQARHTVQRHPSCGFVCYSDSSEKLRFILHDECAGNFDFAFFHPVLR